MLLKPRNKNKNNSFNLHIDDIMGVQHLYGPKKQENYEQNDEEFTEFGNEIENQNQNFENDNFSKKTKPTNEEIDSHLLNHYFGSKTFSIQKQQKCGKSRNPVLSTHFYSKTVQTDSTWFITKNMLDK
jgi:hypothetical protein